MFAFQIISQIILTIHFRENPWWRDFRKLAKYNANLG